MNARILPNCTLITASFNNALLTRIMLMSLWNKMCFPKVLVIDNSTMDFFIPNEQERRLGVSVINNHNYRLTKNWGIGQVSKNHCNSLDYALRKVSTDWAIICDNDILFNNRIIELCNVLQQSRVDIIGEIGYDAVKPARLFPYLCAIRVSAIKCAKISYFDPKRCMIPGVDETGKKCNLYDTGYSFYQDALRAGLKIQRIKLNDYCVHYLHASQTSNKIRIPLYDWVETHRELLEF